MCVGKSFDFVFDAIEWTFKVNLFFHYCCCWCCFFSNYWCNFNLNSYNFFFPSFLIFRRVGYPRFVDQVWCVTWLSTRWRSSCPNATGTGMRISGEMWRKHHPEITGSTSSGFFNILNLAGMFTPTVGTGHTRLGCYSVPRSPTPRLCSDFTKTGALNTISRSCLFILIKELLSLEIILFYMKVGMLEGKTLFVHYYYYYYYYLYLYVGCYYFWIFIFLYRI